MNLYGVMLPATITRIIILPLLYVKPAASVTRTMLLSMTLVMLSSLIALAPVSVILTLPLPCGTLVSWTPPSAASCVGYLHCPSRVERLGSARDRLHAG